MITPKKYCLSLGLLDRYVICEMANPFLFGVMAFTVLLIAGDLLFQLANLIIEKNVSLGVVIRLFVYRIPEVVVMTLPMASLLAALLTFGRLSSQGEIVALKASGVAFQRVIRPVMFASVLVTVMAMLLNETLVPLSNKAADNIMRFEVARERPSMFKEQVFLRDETGTEGLRRIVYISRLDHADGLMDDVVVQEFKDGELYRIVTALRGKWISGQWWLEDGKTFEVAADRSVKLLFSFQKQRLPVLMSPSQVARSSKKPSEMSAWQLWEHIHLMKKQGANLQPLWVMFHLKLALPWACVILALLGAALGVRPQRTSSGVGLAVSVLIVFFYYVIMSFSRSFGEAGYLSPVLAAWLPNLLFFMIALTLGRRANG
ncbi:MAG: LptF/LptG family permease [Synergistota bacterium]|nr:LptF/LptG family permease [Synergistota bacterium]